MTWYSDPNGLAAAIIAVLTVVGTVVGFAVTDDLKQAITTIVAGVVTIVLTFQARRHAFAPKTVDRILVPPATEPSDPR